LTTSVGVLVGVLDGELDGEVVAALVAEGVEVCFAGGISGVGVVDAVSSPLPPLSRRNAPSTSTRTSPTAAPIHRPAPGPRRCVTGSACSGTAYVGSGSRGGAKTGLA
jgi:hypothetical protein